MEIGIREFKDRLSEIVGLAQKGNKITITNHGQAICFLTPIENEKVKLPNLILDAIEQGEIIRAKQQKLNDSSPIVPKKAGQTTTQILLESRRNQRF